MTSKRKGTTEGGRIILKTNGEEPKSARANKRYYQLWKLAKDLKPEEIEMLITKRKQDIKYIDDPDKIRILRTEISILEDTHRIIRKKRAED